MNEQIREAFELAVEESSTSFATAKAKPPAIVRREANLLMKQFEKVIENLPDQSISLQEFYEEIAGQAWHG